MKLHVHRLIDAINTNKLYSSIFFIGSEELYAAPELKNQMLAGLTMSKKFHVGDFSNLPPLDISKIESSSMKLPFPVCYFEFQSGNGGKPMGVLGSYEPANPFLLDFIIFWQTEDSYWYQIPLAIRVNLETQDILTDEMSSFIPRAEAIISRYVERSKQGLAKWADPDVLRQVLLKHTEEEVETYRKQAQAIIDDAPNFRSYVAKEVKEYQEKIVCPVIKELLTFLAVINCVNVKTTVTKPDAKLNKAKLKNRKCPEFSFSTLELSLKHEQELTEGKLLTGERLAARIHWRRGHIKHCRTGNFWWNPHLVGHAEEGAVMHDYEVKQ